MEYIGGNERRFGAEDLFFLTMDTRDVICGTNRVFDSLSHHNSKELIDSPHNIIRHNDMPTGTFKSMWDESEQGRSSCVYMLSRTRDGRDCWVFATIAPLTDGYLSVRVRPTNRAMFIPVKETHVRVRTAEHACAEGGHGHREVVEHGAALLAEELAKFRYHGLYDFVRTVLPRELALLVAEGVRVPPHAESGNPMPTVLQAVAAIGRDADGLVYRLGEYQEFVNGLGSWAVGMCSVTDRADRVGSLMGEVTGPDAESSVPTASGRVKECGVQAVEVLGQPNSSLMALYETASEIRFRSSMMCLHTLTVGIFAATVLDGREGESGNATSDLVEVMLSDLEELMPSCQETVNLVERLEGDFRSVASNLDRVKRPSQRWIRVLQGEGAQALAEGIDAEAVLSEAIAVGERGFPETASLTELVAKARDAIVALDEPVTRQRVAAVRGTLSHLGE